MPPVSTTSEDASTPYRNNSPMTCSRSASRNLPASFFTPLVVRMSDAMFDSVIDHFSRKYQDHPRKEHLQTLRPGLCEHPGTHECATKHSQHNGHGQPRINIAALKIDAHTRRRRHPDHKIARSR